MVQNFKSLISKKKKKQSTHVNNKKVLYPLPSLHRCQAWKKKLSKLPKDLLFHRYLQPLSLSLSLSLLRIFHYLFSFFSNQFFPWFVKSPQTIRSKDRIEFLVNCFLFFILVLGEWKHKGKQMQKLSRMTDVRQSLRDKATRQALSHCERTNMR